MNKLYRLLSHKLSWLVAAIAAGLLLLCPVIGVTAEQKSPDPKTATTPEPAPAIAPSTPSAIPLTDVATRATEAENLLQIINQQSEPIPDIEKIREMLPEIKAEINRNFSDTMIIINQQPMLSVVQTQQQQWQKIRLNNTGWLSLLTKRSVALQASLTRLSELQKIWSMTLEAAKTSKAPQPMLQQIKEILSALHEAQKPLNAQLTTVLDLESLVAEEVAKCDTALAQITQAQKKAVRGIFVQTNLPITSTELWTDVLTDFPGRIHTIAVAYRKDVIRYFHDPYERMPLHAGIFTVLMLLFLSVRHQVRKWSTAGEAISSAVKVFDHPFAAALAVTLLVATSLHWPVPYSVRAMFRVLSVAPIIILIRPVLGTRMVPGLYMLGLLFALDTVREVFSGEPLILQVFLLLESLAGLAALIWFLRNLRSLHDESAGSSRLRVLQRGSGLFIIILFIGLSATVIGYTRLSLLLTPGIIFGGSLAVALYAVFRVMSGMVVFAFHPCLAASDTPNGAAPS